MKRIMIVGGAGAGKSTFARTLGAQTGLPVHHLDKVFWKPNWQRRAPDETRDMVAELEAQDCWIIEGGIAQSYANRLMRADVVIWLDLPAGLRLWRLARRILKHRIHARPDMPEGCDEPLTWARVSFLFAVWRERAEVRKEIADVVRTGKGGAVIHHVVTRAQARSVLHQLALGRPTA